MLHRPAFTRLLLGVLLLVGLTWFLSPSVHAETDRVVIYFFWGDGCPHCARADPFLEDLAQRYPQVELQKFEVWYHPENQEVFRAMAAAFGFEPSGVPTIFIGDRYWVGYSERIGEQIEAYVTSCLASGCRDAGSGVLTPAEEPVAEAETETETETETASEVINVPLLGQVDLAAQSLTVATTLIAIVDGFNPCSLWVLSVLMALTLHTGSRKKVLVVGLVFLTVTAAVYVLFIAGLFTMLTVVSFLGWIQVVVALVALFFALVNIKDYFWYKEGVSFTIADEKKPGIYQRARNILNASDSLGTMVAATVVMGAGVSLVEFSCTAGFPVIWTNMLAAQGVSALTFVLLLTLYMVIYQIDELGIFLAAVLTLRASKLEEKHGRILKLIGGMLMLTLAAVMIIKPALMNNLRNSLIIFGLAFVAAGVVLVVHRRLLPRLGVYIGTELEPRRSKRRRARRRAR